MSAAPELSRFELQCLGRLWALGTGSIRDIHRALAAPPSYSTVKKIVERLEEKGAVERVRQEGRAWVYRSRVKPRVLIQREVRRLIDALFDGQASPLVAHLADMNEITLEDLKQTERLLRRSRRKRD